jgi:hypothetical protein
MSAGSAVWFARIMWDQLVQEGQQSHLDQLKSAGSSRPEKVSFDCRINMVNMANRIYSVVTRGTIWIS